MNLTRRRLLCPLVSAIAVAALLTGCQTTSPPPSPDLLRVGVAPNMPPIIYKDSAGDVVGLEAVMARKLALQIGRNARFVPLAFDDLIPALEQNRIDIIMSGMSITPEREVRVQFAEPYLGLGQTLLVRNQDFNKYRYPEFIRVAIARVGVESGTTGDQFVERNCRNATRIGFKSPRAAAQALLRGEIDVVVHDMPVIMRLASEFETAGLVEVREPVTLEYLAWGVRRGDAALLSAANAAIERWKKSGELQAIVRQYIPVR